MSELVDISTSFPTVLFTIGLFVVFGFWLTALVGIVGIDTLDFEGDASASGGAVGVLPVARSSRGVPVTIVLSLWIITSWVAAVAVSAVADRYLSLPGVDFLLSLAVLIAAPVAAWAVTLFLVMPFGRIYSGGEAASHNDFVGKTCVIRTQSVSRDFGQAEITSSDGSSAVIQVRKAESDTSGAAELSAGETALIFDYDTAGGFFLVAPFDLARGPKEIGT